MQLKDLHSAEKQLMEAIPKMAKGATTLSLQEGFLNHLKETETHVERIKQIGEKLNINVERHVCKAMKGLIEEGAELLSEEGSPSVIDCGLVAAAQRVEHYEISAYLSAISLAELMEHEEAADLLRKTLEEEVRTDEKLQMIVEDDIFELALETVEGIEMEEERE